MLGCSKRRAPQDGGFTLIEVFIALSVLAFGLLGLSVMQLHALRGGSKGHHSSDAVRIAHTQMEQIQRMPFATLEAAAGNGWTAAPWINFAGFNAGEVPVQVRRPDGSTRTQQLYAVSWRVATVAGNPSLLSVDVEVTWTESDNSNTRDTRTGLPTVTLARVRYNW